MSSTTQDVQSVLPLGKSVPRGHVRWYFAACPEGGEAQACEKVRAIIDDSLLIDAFVPRAERIYKCRGTRVTSVRDLFCGYFIVVTADAKRLSQELAKLSFPVWLVGAVGRGFAPIDKDAQEFLASCMDATHTIRKSEAEIVSNELRVLEGPLVGGESRVRKIDRHKHLAMVHMGSGRGSGGFALPMPLSVPVKR